MEVYPETIKKELARLLPLSLIDDVSCFVFYDNHPQDERCIDITVCTKTGELQEYFQRDLVSNIHLKSSPPAGLTMMRNSESKLFYIMTIEDELLIVSSTRTVLELSMKISDVDSFGVYDWRGDGQSFLKVIKKDDAVPIYFDENFQEMALYPVKCTKDGMPIFSELRRKYIQVKHTVHNHEKTIQEYIKQRQAITLWAYLDMHPNDRDSIFKNSSDIYGALKVKTQMPWVKVCNAKVVVALNVLNEYNEPIKDLQILLTCASMISIAYSTKVFTKTNTLPFWKEDVCTLPKSEAAVIAVIPIDELQTVANQIKVKGALSYKCGEKSHLMPFEDVVISSMTTYGDEFDAMASNEFDPNTLLAIIATSHKTDLRIRLLTPGDTIINLLVQYLQMEKIGPNLIMYKKSPYHLLNGAMLHFNGGTGHSFTAVSFTRTKAQLIALIQSINNMVPAKIIFSTIDYAINTTIPELAKFSEPTQVPAKRDYLGYARTIVNRTKMILDYLDYCMVKMTESKDPNVLQKIGLEIDLYAGGKSSYQEFREKMLEEEKIGVECLLRVPTDPELLPVD